MANISKERRDRMIAKLDELKLQHNDDASIAALSEIENALREKKYGLVWEEHSEAVDDMLKDNIPVLIADPERRLCKDKNLPWNFIIEGDNLQALYLLEKTHRGKVDCIYIDPPYNTGARDWKYNNDYVDGNDSYRHSKWLSMMKSRLTMAKKLLNPYDSVLICTIDEKEYLHLGCLLEELFPNENMQMISSVINRQSVARDNEFGRVNEYIFFVMIGNAFPEKLTLSKEWLLGSEETLEKKNELYWGGLLRRGSNNTRKHSPGCFYPIVVSIEKNRVVYVGKPDETQADIDKKFNPEKHITCFPIRPDGTEGCWQLSADKFVDALENGFVKFGKPNKRQGLTLYYLARGERNKIESGIFNIIGYDDDGSVIVEQGDIKPVFSASNQWSIASHDSSQYGTILNKKFLVDRKFPYPKSLYAVHDTIKFFVNSKKDAVVLDFFSGSGTTGHAVALLNAEDGGHRTCIMVTNNELSESEAFELTEKGVRKGSEEWEAKGIAKYITWPRMVCAIEGCDINGATVKGNYSGSGIPMSDGFTENIKYLKCDWTSRKPEEYLLSNALCLHVKEMIELQTAREVDGIKNVLILNKNDYRRVFDNPESEVLVENVWVNENLVFNATEMRKLKSKHFKFIPREYFSQELKEVGEYV